MGLTDLDMSVISEALQSHPMPLKVVRPVFDKIQKQIQQQIQDVKPPDAKPKNRTIKKAL